MWVPSSIGGGELKIAVFSTLTKIGGGGRDTIRFRCWASTLSFPLFSGNADAVREDRNPMHSVGCRRPEFLQYRFHGFAVSGSMRDISI
jgi:hypothetical protein